MVLEQIVAKSNFLLQLPSEGDSDGLSLLFIYFRFFFPLFFSSFLLPDAVSAVTPEVKGQK